MLYETKDVDALEVLREFLITHTVNCEDTWVEVCISCNWCSVK